LADVGDLLGQLQQSDFAAMIFCSVVMVSSDAPRAGRFATPTAPRPAPACDSPWDPGHRLSDEALANARHANGASLSFTPADIDRLRDLGKDRKARQKHVRRPQIVLSAPRVPTNAIMRETGSGQWL
jgi:hypothetical protein